MPKGDRVYAGTDEDARWVPEGAALASYMKERKERETHPERFCDEERPTSVVPEKEVMEEPQETVTMNPDVDEEPAQDDTEIAEPEVIENEADDEVQKTPEGLTKIFGECPHCCTPSSRIISALDDGKTALQCASGHKWAA